MRYKVSFCEKQMQQIDLNCDMGEGMPNDEVLMDYITSANIACGYHAGDDAKMRRTVELCLQKGVAIGAHPGLPDKENFGRIAMQMSPADVYRITVEQVNILKPHVTSAGAKLHHVKPHGALYNMAAKDAELAKAIAQAVYDIDAGLILYGLAGSQMIKAAELLGLKTASEVFADRTYQDDGSLTSRNQNNALIIDEEQAIEQVLMMVKKQLVISVNNKCISLNAETLCLHGDGAHALAFAKIINARLKAEGILLKAPTV